MGRDRAAWGRIVRTLSEADDGGQRLQTCYRFDGLSNLTEVWAGPTTDTTGTQCNFADATLKLQQSSTWDDFGNELSRSDALGRTWQFRYDYYGQLESSQTPEQAHSVYRVYRGRSNIPRQRPSDFFSITLSQPRANLTSRFAGANPWPDDEKQPHEPCRGQQHHEPSPLPRASSRADAGGERR